MIDNTVCDESEYGVQILCDLKNVEKKRGQIREMTFIYLFSQWAPMRLGRSFQRRTGQEAATR